jgi:hypothetical protein
MPDRMNEAERAALKSECERLRSEHRDLDAAIAALEALGTVDQLQVLRLKKRKLLLRDRISRIDDVITPDIIA